MAQLRCLHLLGAGGAARFAALRLVVLALAVGWQLLAVPLASAHAYLDRSDPSAGAILPAAPTRIDGWFTERLTVGVSTFQVYDLSRRRYDRNDSHVDPSDQKHLTVDLLPLPPGLYTVIWSNISADDGHPNKGGFAFTVAAPTPTPVPVRTASSAPPAAAGAALASTPTAVPSVSPSATPLPLPSDSDRAVADLVNPATDRPTAAIDLASGWLAFSGLTLAGGGAVFVLLCLFPDMDSGDQGEVGRGLVQRFLVLACLYGVVGAVGGYVSLLAKAEIATGLPVGDLSSGAVLGALLAPWSGQVWIVREATLALIAVTALVTRLVVRGRESGALRRAALLAIAVLAAVGLVCQALDSHLAAGHVARTLPLGTPALALHLLAVGLWVGGLGFAPLLRRAWHLADDSTKQAIAAVAIARFSALALPSVIVIGVTGLYIAIALFPGIGDLLTSAYGQALDVKTLLFVVLIGFGALNRRHLAAIARAAPAAVGVVATRGHSLIRAMRRELGVACLALLAAGTMLEVGPPGVQLSAAAVQLDATAPLPAPLSTPAEVLASPTATATAMPTTTPTATPSPGYHATAVAGDLALTLDVKPIVAGAISAFDVALSRGGQGSVSGAQVKLFFTATKEDVGSPVETAKEVAPGRYHVDALVFAVDGVWHVQMVVRRDDFPQEDHTFDVDVSPPSSPRMPLPTPSAMPTQTATVLPSPTATVGAQSLHATLAFAVDPPKVGNAAATLHLADAMGKPMANAQVQAVWLMPEHAHVTQSTFEAVSDQPGTYATKVSLSMAGAWLADATVALADGRTVQLQFAFNVRDRGLFG